MKNFKPLDYQKDLNVDQFILNSPELSEETVPMDVLFVGAGPAGLSGALHLKKLVDEGLKSGELTEDIEIGVLEKSESLGGHSLSGAVVNPVALQKLFPELELKDLPLKDKVTKESVYYLTAGGKIPLPTPPTMKNHGNYTASLCEIVRFMGEKAENKGINVFTSFPAASLLMKDQDVIGVRTVASGLGRDRAPGLGHMPATDLTANITVLSEGTRGPLSLAYQKKFNIESASPQIYALGVKELWKVKKPLDRVIHTLGHPFSGDIFGGSWLYPMGDQHVSLGLVAGLDYKNSNFDLYHAFQNLKSHPLFAELLEGGEMVEWGAKTIPEGGYHSLPKKFSGSGLLLAGDAVGFVNVPALKGIHYAMWSGILAAESIYRSLVKKDYSEVQLSGYDEALKTSFIYKDLKSVKNMRQSFKSGFASGAIKSALMSVTGGKFPPQAAHKEEDAAETKQVQKPTPLKDGAPQKVDAVYFSQNKTRDDIPPHLKAGDSITLQVAEFYSSMCPAGVYEVQDGQLVINAPNCIDCKATDVLGPRWEPREGGSGPSYRMM